MIFSLSLSAQNDTVLIDFGSSSSVSSGTWNNVTSFTGGQIIGMVNSKGLNTQLNLQVNDAFTGVNTNGTQNPDPSLGIPVSASGDNFFGNTVLFSGVTEPTGGVLISGLNPFMAYTVILFASRVATDNRQTQYVVSGNVSDTLLLDVSSNANQVAGTTITPSPTGEIQITASPGPANNNTYGFFYLSAMKLVYTHELPDTSYLDLVSPLGGEFWQVGKTAAIQWHSRNVSQLVIEYSTDGMVSWNILDTVFAFQQSYPWLIPNSPSKQCFVRLKSAAFSVQPAFPFEISSDTNTCRIVVLGSSTAAGAGATFSDSAWVNLYRSHVTHHNTRYEVINLAKGGYTTFHILPTGTTMPPGVTVTVDTARNISKAMTYAPVALIVNMPSNDAASNFSAQMQLNNYRIISDIADAAGISVWICTPQPRNFSNPLQIQTQIDVRDSLLAIYQDHAIDFWTGMATVSGYIKPEFDSGDGVHLNNRGHRELCERVIHKQLDTVFCAPYLFVNELYPDYPDAFQVYPNPAGHKLWLEFETQGHGEAAAKIYDLSGRVLEERVFSFSNPGKQAFEWELLSTDSERQFCLLKVVVSDPMGTKSFATRLIIYQKSH
ncbi:MAG TPA: GDSL-type esterase/lipase family protein [Bacteroidales bacterium]|nr:GDSL-type esterase/lipase family protein [Bacteroidales bacterium]HRZ49845.1 GDSL-type esterase/lipase family protein [Bacteroidales bacterium]